MSSANASIVMTEFLRFEQALALTESDDDQKAWGDQGLAMGRWQMHVAFVDEWWPDDIGVDWSWDHLFAAALQRFYSAKFAAGVTLQHMVMQFHLGEKAQLRGDHDDVYWTRFVKFYNQLGNPPLAA
jgi:hypothetical protein